VSKQININTSLFWIVGIFDYPRKKVKLMEILSNKASRKEEADPN
jgi:hypothetical protein